MAEKLTKAELLEANKKLEEKVEKQGKSLKSMEKVLEKLTKEDISEKETSPVREESSDKYDTEKFNIRPDEYVEIISLCPTDLYLSLSPSDDTPEKFEYVGESKHVLYKDLVKYINRHKNFARNGTFYIVDKRIVKRHSLIDFYDEILTKDEISLVMTSDSEKAIEMFKMANENQQQFLSDMFIRKIISGEDVDMNMVYQMGQVLGTDVAKQAEDAKEFKNLILGK